MESILCVNIPVQMISCTDTNGKITPLRFRFKDNNGELVTVTIKDVISDEQDPSRVGANFTCSAIIGGVEKKFKLWYNYFAHEWRLSQLRV